MLVYKCHKSSHLLYTTKQVAYQLLTPLSLFNSNYVFMMKAAPIFLRNIVLCICVFTQRCSSPQILKAHEQVAAFSRKVLNNQLQAITRTNGSWVMCRSILLLEPQYFSLGVTETKNVDDVDSVASLLGTFSWILFLFYQMEYKNTSSINVGSQPPKSFYRCLLEELFQFYPKV